MFHTRVETTTVVKFEDGKYLGVFRKVDSVFDAIQFDGIWGLELHLKNHPVVLKDEKFEVKNIRVKTEIEFSD